jgi:hypothetical protein
MRTSWGRAMDMQASVWYRHFRLEEAKSEILHALEILEKLGAASNAEACGELLQEIELAIKTRSTRFKVSFYTQYQVLHLLTPTSQHEVHTLHLLGWEGGIRCGSSRMGYTERLTPGT